ncbi:MAG: hypothetical protein KJ063_21780 [Anaerolineae bacterium]|nr:hypothetical protein [Anaerolineae bacterium]
MSQFSGLTMPVFSAFGWAGEEAAVKYALSQLELFIRQLHGALPQEVQSMLPHFGVDHESQTVYLASSRNLEAEPYITFQARPLSFEMSLHIRDEMHIGKMLSVAERQFDSWYTVVQQLGEDWTIRIQQMEIVEGGRPSHYQDLVKGPVVELERDAALEIINRALYLHGEEKWITPLYFTLRLHADIVSGMGPVVIATYREQISRLLPLLQFILAPRKGSTPARPTKGAKTRTPRSQQAATTSVIRANEPAAPPMTDEQDQEILFHYISELKPLHIRKGFINLKPHHWTFFALSPRTETRPVIIRYHNKKDSDSAIWHMTTDNQTRIMLGAGAQHWLENNFAANDSIEVTAYRVKEKEIELLLKPVNS